MQKNSKIYIAGHNGMVGSACWRKFKSEGYTNLIGMSSKDLDLRNQKDVLDFLSNIKPDLIIDAAARVGGILANATYPYQFLMDNMLIQNNLIKTAHELDIKKFIFLGSSCIYPKEANQPLKEEYLLTGPLEKTNEWYAIAKISGVKLIESLRKQYSRDYVSLMPTNLYGPFDNFDLETSHVLPAMIIKFHDAKINGHAPVQLWGSGTPKREFLHVDDLASAVFFVSKSPMNEHLYNVGSNTDLTIRQLSSIIRNVVGHSGKVQWDSTKPDGTMRKIMDSKKLNDMGWTHKIHLNDGIKMTYKWFIENIKNLKNVKI